VLLKKNPFPPRDHLEKELLFDGKALFGDRIHLNAWTNQILWAEVEIRRSLLGKALSFFYKPRLCYIGYRCVGIPTEQDAERFITQLGRGGCMLTPLVENNWDLLDFYASRNDLSKLRNLSDLRRMEDFAFFYKPGDQWAFDKEFRIRLYAVPPPTQRIELHETLKE
jgi:hypothetical protein